MPPDRPRQPVIHFELYALSGDGWALESWHDDKASALARAEAARARAGCRGVKVIRETYYPRRHAAHERVILDTTRRRRPRPPHPPAPALPAPRPSGARAGPTRVAASLVGVASVAALAAATAAVIALT